jgi:hypothetical protein
VNSRLKASFARCFRLSLGFWLLTVFVWAAAPFQHDVLPLMEKNCITCHGGGLVIMGGLDLRTLAGVMGGSSKGPAVVPGSPDESRIWIMVRDGKMPMGGSAPYGGGKAACAGMDRKRSIPFTAGRPRRLACSEDQRQGEAVVVVPEASKTSDSDSAQSIQDSHAD